MLTCPHCQKQALTQRSKSVLGPAKTLPCQSCGKAVSVHWAGLLMLIPFFLGGMGALALLPSLFAMVPIAIGVMAMFAIHAYWVTLVPRYSRVFIE